MLKKLKNLFQDNISVWKFKICLHLSSMLGINENEILQIFSLLNKCKKLNSEYSHNNFKKMHKQLKPTTVKFIRSIRTVIFSVTPESVINTCTITTGKLIRHALTRWRTICHIWISCIINNNSTNMLTKDELFGQITSDDKQEKCWN